MPRRIEVLGFPACQLLDVAGPLQVFASANDMARSMGLPAPYEPVVVAATPRLVTSSGLALEAAPLPPDDLLLDTLVISGGWGVYDACDDIALVGWIKARASSARRATSVCSGAFLLASTGLLDGRRAVTHWWRCAEFAARFPAVKLDPDPIFIADGKYWTSAGVTAGIDLALALVEADLGRDLALSVARQLVVFLKRPGGQSQFSAALTLQDQGGRFDALHGWIMENLDRPLALPELADRAGMSERNFSRRYRAETGRTPARAVEDLRIETARRLLEQSLSVARVASRCGFGSEETLRRAFLRRVGVSPQAYRERFAA
ncbi:GlxA family transcriptional regulator [Devosia sediminis]|uniref:GlxA family transcriptional regulator n=1 Tax=Devosia sediminis TaxID=2798801 RepID=A0A934ITS1_9HYPH|nr:GlxA family transcriptional regulator [Devosia sediminis]MBJ3784192.1 GlxA family transcriptional regulator [Devosia sediminis]